MRYLVSLLGFPLSLVRRIATFVSLGSSMEAHALSPIAGDLTFTYASADIDPWRHGKANLSCVG